MTTTEPTKEQAFIDRIERLNPGELAALRRGCGERNPVEGRCPWLHGLIYGVASEPTAFLTASLLAQYKTSVISSKSHSLEGNFGITWKRAIQGTDSDSIRRRFHILLDSEFDPRTGDGDLPYRLRQMVRYAASENVGVDWPELLKHLRSWNSPDKWVQKAWARSYFANERPGDATTNPEREN
ncbi:MAG: type I-E CRISPR-associated protein Cse2/CasB [Fimbriimonas sp.]